MAYRAFVKEFSKQQLLDMSPGGRMDVSDDAEFKLEPGIYTKDPVSGAITGHADVMVTGTRFLLTLMEPIFYSNYQQLQDLGKIDGYRILFRPFAHNGKDAINPPRGFGWMFPTAAEVAERLAELP
jgi:hypothetical protein